MKSEVIQDACEKSFTENKPFSEVIKHPAEAGVESYDADRNQLQKIYYAPNGEAFVTPLKTQPLGTAPEQFDANAVKRALGTFARRKSAMRNFCGRLSRREHCFTPSIFADDTRSTSEGSAILTTNIFRAQSNECLRHFILGIVLTFCILRAADPRSRKMHSLRKLLCS